MKQVHFKKLIERALEEDCFCDDVTSALFGEEGIKPCEGVVSAKQAGVFFGFHVCEAFSAATGGRVLITALKTDGSFFSEGEILAEVHGSFRDLLGVERVILNLLCHACGVASVTRCYVEAVFPFPVKILATRKTLPGLRELELGAVAAGGGFVHRRSLSDGILIKENYLSKIKPRELLRRAKQQRSPLHRVEIEVQDLSLLEDVLSESPDIIMLDNFSLDDVRTAIGHIAGKAEIEVSGGISIGNVRGFAELGVHYISVGRLTHSASSVDLSFDFR